MMKSGLYDRSTKSAALTLQKQWGRRVPFLIIGALLAWSLSGCDQEKTAVPSQPETTASVEDTESQQDVTRQKDMDCIYYERELFLTGMSAPSRYQWDGRLVAGVVPHHLLASDMIAGFFSQASKEKDRFDTVLLLSPSHFPENCGSDVVTASAGWQTPYGRAEVDQGIVSRLLDNQGIDAEDNPAAVEWDHGVGGLIPFVKYYLPDAKIATCLLSNKLSHQRLGEVWREVADICAQGRTLLVVSADFSHYLMPVEAALHDEQTRQSVAEMDLRKILTFSDSNVDSPQSLTTFLWVADAQDAQVQLLGHSSSVDKISKAISNPIYLEGITTYHVYCATVEEG